MPNVLQTWRPRRGAPRRIAGRCRPMIPRPSSLPRPVALRCQPPVVIEKFNLRVGQGRDRGRLGGIRPEARDIFLQRYTVAGEIVAVPVEDLREIEPAILQIVL